MDQSALRALELRPGDEILTTDEEHPGLLAPLGLARSRRGVEVRVVPFDRIAEETGPRTRLVACSHVSWITGRVVDTAALAACDAPVLLDGAQGIGAVPLDVHALATTTPPRARSGSAAPAAGRRRGEVRRRVRAGRAVGTVAGVARRAGAPGGGRYFEVITMTP